MRIAELDRRAAVALAGLMAGAVMLSPGLLEAGGSLGWAESVTTLSEEGQSAGASAIPLIIIGIGVIIAFSLQALAGIAISALGGAVLIGNAMNVSTTLVPGEGGGSIFDAIPVGVPVLQSPFDTALRVLLTALAG